MNKPYNLKQAESKWQKKWLQEKIYQPDLSSPKKPFYNLMMFPYPSAEGLHVGNMYAFTGADIYARFKRMQGNEVFEPIGLDGFGIHSENYAIKVGRHPKEHARLSQENFYKQLQSIGNSFAWENRLETYDPEYYKWTQWLFIKLFKAGLAYRASAVVNWCPSCKTVLADEQVEDGHCERCKHEVERVEMSSWYFSITEYADELLSGISAINWPQKITVAQKNWIGKKAGINVDYPVIGRSEVIKCFTTRPDTNFGATFVVLAPEHELVQKIIQKDIKVDSLIYLDIVKYVENALNKSEQERLRLAKDKTGVFTGLYVENPLNNKKLPVWIGDFVLKDVGTGAVVAVPAHDERDMDFAKKYDLPVVSVIEEDKYINSDFLNGLSIEEGVDKMIDYMVSKGLGEKTYNYHIRDWLISRQRYWGPPIPMLHCKKCADESKNWFDTDEANKAQKLSKISSDFKKNMVGWYPVELSDLPVILPDIEDFKPKGDGSSPLSNASDDWKTVKCPHCGGEAKRELDVSDTFLDSSWYFLAYPNLHTKAFEGFSSPFDKKITNKWLPVNAYIGGAEHAVLHLLYARFITKVLNDLGYIEFNEPAPFFFAHGLIIKDGAKMSKSKGNVINPDDYIEKYGTDVLRTYLMFLGPFDQGGDFRDSGIDGMSRFLKRVGNLVVGDKDIILTNEDDSKRLYEKLHQTIKKVTEDIGEFKYNTALSAIMELVNLMQDLKNMPNVKRAGDLKCAEWEEAIESLVQILAPFAPHLSEEMWVEVLGKPFSVHTSNWPSYNKEAATSDHVTIAIQVNGKLRGQIELNRADLSDKVKVINKAKNEPNVKNWIEANEVKKEIYIEGKIVNFVV